MQIKFKMNDSANDSGQMNDVRDTFNKPMMSFEPGFQFPTCVELCTSVRKKAVPYKNTSDIIKSFARTYTLNFC